MTTRLTRIGVNISHRKFQKFPLSSLTMSMEERQIFYMENRHWGFLFHFFIFTIGGLRHCKGTRPLIYIPYMRPALKELDEKMVRSLGYSDSEVYTTRDFPADYNWDNCKIHYEICDLLKEKYQFIFSLEDFPDYEHYSFVKCFGEPAETWEGAFAFLKQTFEEIAGVAPLDPKKYIYITRKGSETISLHGGKKVRCILNEDEVLQTITPLGFQCVQLETLPFLEKIRLFQSAKVVMAPNTAALMFCIFSNPKSHIVECIPNYVIGQFKTHWNQTQYKVMCEVMGIPYTRFQQYTYVEDYLNGNLHIPSLWICLQAITST